MSSARRHHCTTSTTNCWTSSSPDDARARNPVAKTLLGRSSASRELTLTPRWHWLGRAAYGRVLEAQQAARARVWDGEDGVVLLCEHPATITLGRSATEANIVNAGDIPVVRIERGGEVTYHGPGQLMVYAIVRIRSVVEFLERVAGALVDACAAVEVTGAEWRREPAGVWRGDAKLAACGIHVSRGVPVHGFALDVATPAEAWRRIRPCGLDRPTVSIERIRADRAITVERMAIEVGPRVAQALSVR